MFRDESIVAICRFVDDYMRDPLLIDEGEKRLPDEWRRTYLKRPVDQLPADVSKAFDRVWKMEREKDRLAAKLDKTEKKLSKANLKIWIMSLIVSPTIAAIAKAIWAKIFP